MHISDGSDGKKTSHKNNRDKREEEEQNTNSGINTHPIDNKKIKMKDKEGNWRCQFLWAIRVSNHVFASF